MTSELYNLIMDCFIESTNGAFLKFPDDEQERMIMNVAAKLPQQ